MKLCGHHRTTVLYSVVICIMETNCLWRWKEGEGDKMSVYLSQPFQLHITEIHHPSPQKQHCLTQYYFHTRGNQAWMDQGDHLITEL